MSWACLGLKTKLTTLYDNYTAALATKLDTNCDATISSRASSTTQGTINTNVSTLVTSRCTEARMSVLDDMGGAVPGVVNTLSSSGAGSNSHTFYSSGVFARYAQYDDTVSTTQDSYVTVLEESAGTAGRIDLLSIAGQINSKTVHIRLTIDGTVVYSVTSKSLATTTVWDVIGYSACNSSSDLAPVFGMVPFTDGFKLEVNNTSNSSDIILISRYYRTA